MGGSGGSGGGGGHYTPPSYDKIKDLIDSSKDQASRDNFRTQVNDFLNDLLKNVNNRDSSSIQDRLNEIKKILSDILETELSIIFGGSVSKHTYVNGLSDVDSLLIINDSTLTSKQPSDIINFLVTKLSNEGLNATGGNLAVTVTYGDGMEIQLLPAIRLGDNVKISNPEGTGWSDVNPKGFTEKLTKVNQDCGSKVVPIIKLAKALNASFPSSLQLTGYHIESLAIECFKSYSGSYTTCDMLNHFFKESSSKVLGKIKDSTGQSVHVDDYLGDQNSKERQNISHILKRTHLKMDNALASSSIDDWKELFGED